MATETPIDTSDFWKPHHCVVASVGGCGWQRLLQILLWECCCRVLVLPLLHLPASP